MGLREAAIIESRDSQGDVDDPDDPKFRGSAFELIDINQTDNSPDIELSPKHNLNTTQPREKREVDRSSIEKSENLRQTIIKEQRRKMLEEREILKLKMKKEKRNRAIEQKKEKIIQERKKLSRKFNQGRR